MSRPARFLPLFVPIWLAITGLFFFRILQYETASGSSGTPAMTWPIDTDVQRDLGRTNLVVAIHPRCPCTRATIDELAELMACASDKIALHVLVYRPSSSEENWEQTDIWRSVAAIPGVELLTDIDGEEASRFGAETSGPALLYDASGKLIFSGGLTNARGHAGESVGRNAILALVGNSFTDHTRTAVYGCSLTDRIERCTRCQE